MKSVLFPLILCIGNACAAVLVIGVHPTFAVINGFFAGALMMATLREWSLRS
jgi:hypothetical protein